ncbi:zinc finger MYM-type protein 1-like isoform X1 [Aquarana catesbeiana]|uniref:zinc finger MYM-type protein 1-like isoform X1 n=1 Tax=Aquarana catesbeiana TaxID=8400 RepID=UPI003CC9791A
MENQPPLTSPDGSSNGNPPERCPLPLYSRDSTQEDHTISNKDINQSECNNAVKEEFKEEEGEVGVMDFSEGHNDSLKDVARSTQEDPIISHKDINQNDCNNAVKEEIKEENEVVVMDFSEGHNDSLKDVARSTQEDPIISHKGINQNDCNNAVKEEIKKEEDHEVGVMELSEGHKDPLKDVPMETVSDSNPPERCPHPLNSRDSTQEGHTIPHHHQGEERINITAKVTEEQVETNVGGDQPSEVEVTIEGEPDEAPPTSTTSADPRGKKRKISVLEMKENSVLSLQKRPFTRRSDEEKKRIKELGPDRPNLNIQQQTTDRGRAYTRSFSNTTYQTRTWLTGCEASHAFFCFPCLLIQSPGTDTVWTTTGVCDLKHLTEKSRRHESTRSHLENTLKFHFFGKCSIAKQLDEGYRMGIRRHNEEVTKNRQILSRIIDCMKFCGAFELALHGSDESSDNPGIFRGLVDFVASLDGVLKDHLLNATVFNGTSKTVQDELLDCMLSVMREHIIQEVRTSDFLSIQVDETSDITTQCQLVLVLRYIDSKSNVQERFFEFITLDSNTADSIATALKQRLAAILPEDQRSKFISQAYDGASVMWGVQKKMQEVYPKAHCIHCYAHPLNLIMEQATSRIPKVRVFFATLGGFASFFSKSPKCTDVLDKVVAHRLPTSSRVSWTFHSHSIYTVFKHREDLLRCFQTIQDSSDFDPVTVRAAGGLAMLLEDQDFKFFLHFFHNVMPHVDLLYVKLQKKNIDSAHIKGSIQQFQQDIQKIRSSLHSLVDQSTEVGSQPKRRCSPNPEVVHKRIAQEVCDIILRHTMERFSFTTHLVGATLVQADRFKQYTAEFPEDILKSTLKAYPVLNSSRLKTELFLIYCTEEFRTCRGAVDLLQLFMENNLEEVFVETIALLKILITTPMTTAEPVRCFSTLERVKTFLRNSTTQESLNALAMLSIEKRLVNEMTDFNQKVIEKFAVQKERRATFSFK